MSEKTLPKRWQKTPGLGSQKNGKRGLPKQCLNAAYDCLPRGGTVPNHCLKLLGKMARKVGLGTPAPPKGA